MGIGKIQSGSIARRQTVIKSKGDGAQVSAKVSDLSVFAGLERMESRKQTQEKSSQWPAFRISSIGETIADANDPIALPPVTIDEPTVQMTFSVNNSPFAGREGKYLTSRHLRERLFKESETNVSLRVNETDSPDRFLVAGRGELHLAVLIEQMRREGYELQVSQPEVIMRQENGKVTTEPYEDLSIEVPRNYQGSVIEEVGQRRGEIRHMKVIHSEGNISDTHMEFSIPTRGVIGLKNVLLAKTRGTVIMHHVFTAMNPQRTGRLVAAHGSLCAFEDGTSKGYGLFMTQERGVMFIGPGVEVYRGMVVGENSRDEDLDVNICKAKQLSNMRASGSDEALVLTPPQEISLEYALEYIGTDELVEITPSSIRIRKRLLNPEDRRKPGKRPSKRSGKGYLPSSCASRRNHPNPPPSARPCTLSAIAALANVGRAGPGYDQAYGGPLRIVHEDRAPDSWQVTHGPWSAHIVIPLPSTHTAGLVDQLAWEHDKVGAIAPAVMPPREMPETLLLAARLARGLTLLTQGTAYDIATQQYLNPSDWQDRGLEAFSGRITW